ncbi:hypothetical protein EP7_001655 [Isosphaeraceae bacterium EP7]
MRIRTVLSGCGPLLAVLLAWNSVQLARFDGPMRLGHEAFIGRQIGRVARNHVVLGLGVTKGANATTLRDDGRLDLHRSYSPMASWTVALPMAMGLPYHASIRLPVLVSLNLFLVGLWSFARSVWGQRVANLAVVFAGLCPVLLWRHGLTCIFEILALGPLMVTLALLARPSRSAGGWALVIAGSIVAAMDSWICWLILIPALLVEARRNRATPALAAAFLAIVVPLVVHVGTTGLASGNVVDDLAGFARHVVERSSARADAGKVEITYPLIVQLLIKRWVRNIGTSTFVATIVLISAMVFGRLRGKPIPGASWMVGLLAFALPLNLARNIAYLHDFFVILFIPSAALSLALVTSRLASRFEAPRRRAVFLGLVVAWFTLGESLPKYRAAFARRPDAVQSEMALAIGRAIDESDFVLASPGACGLTTETALALGEDRHRIPLPTYFGLVSQGALVAVDAADAERLAARARPGQRVVLVVVAERQAAWKPPASFKTLDSPSRSLALGVLSGASRVAGGGPGDRR